MNLGKFRRFLPLVVLTISLIAIGYYLHVNREILSFWRQMTLFEAVGLILLRFVFLVVNGLILQIFVNRFGITLTLAEWIGLPIVTTMGNHITPLSGGMLFRATYLKQQYALPFTHFATLLLANYLVVFWCSALVAAAITVPLAIADSISWMVPIFFMVILVGTILFTRIPVFKFPAKHRVFRLANEALSGWGLIKTNPRLLSQLILVTFVSIVLNGWSFWLAFESIDMPISWQLAFLVGLSTTFSALLNITPGNLGVREVIISLTSGVLGTGVAEGLVTGLLIRASTLVSVFLLGPIFSLYLTHKMNKEQDSVTGVRNEGT